MRQAREPETVRVVSPHDLTDTRACRPIIPIPAAVTDPDHVRPLAVGDCPGLLERLAMLPDPRDRRGRRPTPARVLAVSAAAAAAGARSVAAIAEWATDALGPVLAALGVRGDPLTRRCHVPGEATIRRVLARVDGDAVDATVGAWLADRLRPLRPRRVLAVDGKTLRGSARDGHQVHLLAAWTTMTAPCSPNARSTARRVQCPPLPRCWPAWTSPVSW